VNLNLHKFGQYGQYINISASTQQIALGGLDTAPPGGIYSRDPITVFFAELLSFQAGKTVNYTGEPISGVVVPIVDNFGDDRKAVAILFSILRWSSYFEGILASTSQPVHVVLSNSCQGAFSFLIRGESVSFIGKGNLANSDYEEMALSVNLDASKFIVERYTIALTLSQDLCQYNLKIYPTEEGDDYYSTALPLIITFTVAAVFLMTATVFYFYDVMVEKRQKVVLDTAERSTAIVSSIFPKKVRDKLLSQAPVQGNATKLRSYANSTAPDLGRNDAEATLIDIGPGASSSTPIADLFPECTGKWRNDTSKTIANTVPGAQPFWILLFRCQSYVCGRRRFHCLVVCPGTLASLHSSGDNLCRF
jgi:hypothetical protein